MFAQIRGTRSIGSAPIGKIPSYPAFVSKMGSEVERDQEAAAAQERGEAVESEFEQHPELKIRTLALEEPARQSFGRTLARFAGQ